MPSASRSIEIDVPPEKFFRVLQDYARYPEFLPEVKAVKVGPREGDAVEVTYWLDVKLKMYEFTLRHVDHPFERIDDPRVGHVEFPQNAHREREEHQPSLHVEHAGSP